MQIIDVGEPIHHLSFLGNGPNLLLEFKQKGGVIQPYSYSLFQPHDGTCRKLPSLVNNFGFDLLHTFDDRTHSGLGLHKNQLYEFDFAKDLFKSVMELRVEGMASDVVGDAETGTALIVVNGSY